MKMKNFFIAAFFCFCSLSSHGGIFQFTTTSYRVGERASNVVITIKRTGTLLPSESVSYLTSDITAVAGISYSNSTGTVVFTNKQATRTFLVPILNNTLDEANKTFGVSLSDPDGGGSIGLHSNAVVTIADDDKAGMIRLSAAKYYVAENGTNVIITVRRSGGLASGVQVDYNTESGSATPGKDYTEQNGTLTFSSGEAVKSFAVQILDNSIVDGNRTFAVALSNPTGGAILGLPRRSSIIIRDNDCMLQFSASQFNTAETHSSAQVTVTRSGSLAGTVAVESLASEGSAREGLDYLAVSNILIFNPGVKTRAFTVRILNDSIHETLETILLRLTNSTGSAVLGLRSNAVLMLGDNDLGGSIRFSRSTYTAGTNATVAKITVNRTGGAASEVTVNYSTEDGTAQAGHDYTPVTGTLTFNAGVKSLTFYVSVVHQTNQPVESFALNLSNPTGGASLGSPQVAIVNIHNDLPIIRSKFLSISPMYQETDHWCWLTVGAMIFRYRGVPSINSYGDYECGIASLIGSYRNPYTGLVEGPCLYDCTRCANEAAGSVPNLQEMLRVYPNIAGYATRYYPYPSVSSYAVGNYISPSTVIREINAGRPIIPWIFNLAHVALIVGYDQVGSKITLVINDPFPYAAYGQADPYLAAGGQNVAPLQYRIDYIDFRDSLMWVDTIMSIH